MLSDLPALPAGKRALVEHLVGQLSQVAGLTAVVLGGSYASGTQHEASDLDLGLYYHEATPFSLDQIRLVAEAVAVRSPITVTGFYEWGAWVNGGAWLPTAQGKVDFLYRNLDQVQRAITEAHQGLTHHDYDQQPTFGFYSVIYLAETQICLPLYDPEGRIADLKRQVAVYPPRLKHKIVADSLWAAEFTLLHARGFAAQGDVYNTVGCLTRVVSNLTQALFALNERYYLRDKRVLEVIAMLPLVPPGYLEQINGVLAQPGSTAAKLTGSVSALAQTWRSVVSLPGVNYQPKFQL